MLFRSTGQPTNRSEPKTIERQNPDLPPGTRKVVQPAGPGGFAITYSRRVYVGNRLKRDETFRWTYRPENQIIELGPPAPQEAPGTPTTTTPAKPPATTTPRTTPTTPATTGGTLPLPPTP